MSIKSSRKPVATRESLDLVTESKFYALGRKDSEPEKYKRLNIDLFCISSVNAARIAKENGLGDKWTVAKFFNSYAKSLAA